MCLGLALSYFLPCRAPELWANADGKVHPEFCLTRSCLPFFRGELRFPSRTELPRTPCTCGSWRRRRTRESGVHDHADAFGERRGGRGRCDARFRSSAGAPCCAPLAPGGITPNGQVVPARLETVHPDGSGSSVAPHYWEQRPRPGVVRIALGENRRGKAAGGARRSRAPNPTRGQVEIARVYDVCAGGRGRGRLGLGHASKNGVDATLGSRA